MECANYLTKLWLTSLPCSGGSFASRHVVVVVVLFCSVPNSEQLFRLDWNEIHGPKGKIPVGRSERSPKRSASPP